MTLLIVDDEPLILRAMARLLREHRVLLAANVNEALALLKEHPIEAVLSDVMMPGGLGTDLHRWVVEHQPALVSRFYFMTGAVLDSGARAYLAQSTVLVLAKPMGAGEVRALFEE